MLDYVHIIRPTKAKAIIVSGSDQFSVNSPLVLYTQLNSTDKLSVICLISSALTLVSSWALWCGVILWDGLVWCNMEFYFVGSAVWYGMPPYGMQWHGMLTQRGLVCSSMVWHGMVCSGLTW